MVNHTKRTIDERDVTIQQLQAKLDSTQEGLSACLLELRDRQDARLGVPVEVREHYIQYRDALAKLDTALTALHGFSKHCIKPECKCWSCEALRKLDAPAKPVTDTTGREWTLNVRYDGTVRGVGRPSPSGFVTELGSFYSDNQDVRVREVVAEKDDNNG